MRNRPRRYHEVTNYADRLAPGTVVVDSEQPPEEQDEAVVVAVPYASIDEWNVVPWRDRTVADDNPTYRPHEWTTIIVYKSELDTEFPYYSGQQQLSLTHLTDLNINFYAFPDSRLTRKRMQRAHEIPLSNIRPFKYHARSFAAADNESFIEETRDRGFPVPYPTVRVRNTGTHSDTPTFELLDGHKRTWVAHVADLTTIKCHCVYVTDREAARRYLTNHFDSLTSEQQEHIKSRVNTDFNTTVTELRNE